MLLSPLRAQAICVGLGLFGVAATQTFSGSGSGFDPYETGEFFGTVSFQVGSLVSVLPCTYYVVLRSGQGTVADRRMNYGVSQLKYNAYIDTSKANILSDDAGATGANTIHDSFATVLGVFQYKAHSFVWSVKPVQQAPSSGGGFYADALYLDVYEGNPGSGSKRDSAPVTFRARVPVSVDVAVVASGGVFNVGSTTHGVDFGPVSSGAQRSFDISVRSNAGYGITLASANGQKLVKTAPTAAQTIPYSLTVNGAAQDLSAGSAVTVAQSSPGAVTPATGTNLPVGVTLGNVPAALPAGIYQDTLSVNVSAY